MRRFFHENGLLIAMFGLFVVFWLGQTIAGYLDLNQDLQEHNKPLLSYPQYLLSGHMWEATFENWESEYLQMGLFVLLTAFLFQKGAAESETPEQREKDDQEVEETIAEMQNSEGAKKHPDIPGPMRKGRISQFLYEYSLTISLLVLFVFCFIIHAIGGAREYSREQLLVGQPSVTTIQYMATARFWFESLQNWQSEFIGVASLTFLSIFLRQRGSPESKKVIASHETTGTE